MMELVLMNSISDVRKLVSNRGEFCSINNMLLHIVVKESGREANLNSSFHLISGEYPNLDPSLLERNDGVLY